MKKLLLLTTLISATLIASAYDWDGIAIPVDPPSGSWELHSVSDEFNYESTGGNRPTEFSSRWNENYINNYSGPSATYYHADHAWTSGGYLCLHANWDLVNSIIYTGCISSVEAISWPMYLEANIKLAGCMLANNVWMISADEVEELDVMETYPNIQEGGEWFERRLHLSHHVFIRDPFTDYQPRDEEGVYGTWYMEEDRDTWQGDWFRVAVYWRDPTHVEYYINGEWVRTLDAYEHSYKDSTGTTVSYTTDFNAFDKYGYTSEGGLSQPQHIILNMEQQSWLTDLSIFPTEEDLTDENGRNIYYVDWIRVYNPSTSSSSSSGGSSSGGSSSGGSSSGGSSSGGSSSGGTLQLTNVGDELTLALGGTYQLEYNSSDFPNVHFNTNSGYASVDWNTGLISADEVSNEFNATITIYDDGGSGQTDAVDVYVVASSSSGGSSSGGSSSGGSSSGGSSSGGSSSGGSITIQAEDFTSTGGTIDDSSYGGPGYGVNDAGSTINYVNSGDWAEYSISVSDAGTYSIAYQISTPMDNAQVQIAFDGSIISTDNVTSNSAWDSYYSLDAANDISLTSGSHTVLVTASGSNDWQWNMDYISLDYISGSSSGGSSSGGSSSGGSSSGGSSSGGSSSGGQTPYGGTAWSIPGSIESVNFDEGGSGVAYYDNTSGNSGTGPRSDTDVDTEYRISAGNVGWIAANEWLEYTVNVASSGYYNIGVQVASIYSTGAFHIKFAGTDKTGTQTVGSTGAWGTFTTKSISNVYLNAGQQVMQVYMSGSGFNLGTMTFTSTGSSSSSSGGSSSGGSSSSGAGTTITVQAEDFTSTGGTIDESAYGGPGLGVNDAGTIINWVNNGDWADYSVSVPYDGNYELVYYISSPIDGSTIAISVDGTTANTTTVPNNGAWDSYSALTAGNISLDAGTRDITLTAGAQTWTWNLDYFTLEWVSAKDDQESTSTELTDLRIYPNPAQDYINVVLHGTLQAGAQIMIYQSTGSLVQTSLFDDNRLNIHTGDLPNGMYIIKVINGSEVISKSLLISR